MSGHIETVEAWSAAPDQQLRTRKRMVEEELLNKLGVKAEFIELHPVILSSRIERPRFYGSLKYSRVSPPMKEILPKSRNPWLVDDLALRQISNPSRHGPRDNILPNLVKPHVRIRVHDIPAADIGYHERRAAANACLTQFFTDWTAYNKMAFPVPARRKPQVLDHNPTMKVSRRSLIKVAQGQHSRKSSSSTMSSGNDIKKGIRPVPKSRKQRNRWKDIIREVRLHLQAARMKLPQELNRSELRIYVSSTPDLQEEREFLEAVTYPKLQELCDELGVNIHVVDLRSGAGILNNDLETFDLIKKELRICRKQSIGPVFISLIGHALDDQNLPGFLHKRVYEEIRDTMIKENITGVDIFDEAYRLDSNQTPPVYLKQPISSVEEYQSPEEVEKTLYNALLLAVNVIVKKNLNNEPTDVDFYKWSAVVNEIEEGLLNCYTPGSDTLCFMLDVDDINDTDMKTATPIQQLRHKVFEHYKQFASRRNLVSFKSGKKSMAFLRSISDTVESRVTSLLKYGIRYHEYDITAHLTESSEVTQHVRAVLHETQNNSGNEDTLPAIKDILERIDTSSKIILLWGQSGTGKTAAVSQVASSSAQWQPRRKVVFRCLGTTLRSSSLYRVLESLIKQLNFLYSLSNELPLDFNLEQVVSLFCYTLKAISAEREIYGDLLLILDQLERLPDLETHHLLQILNSVTTGTTLILTLQTPNTLFNVLTFHRHVQAIFIPYMNEKKVSKYVTENLKAINRVVTSDQLQSALNALPSDITPLHTQMLFHLMRGWPSHTLPELKQLSDRPDTDFVVFIEMIERELGQAFTRYALSFLASARHGLADQEIFHLLSKDSDLLNEIKEEGREIVSIVDGFPYQYQISRLITRLGKFINNFKLEGENIYQLTVQTLVDAISSKYMSDSFFFIIHFRLASFFMFIRRGLLLSSKDISEQKHKQLSKYHWRTLRCIPYHLCHSSADTGCVWARLKEKVFFNFTWLVNMVYSGCFNELLEDIAYALDNVSLDSDIQYLQHLLISVRNTVTHNPICIAAIFASLNPENSNNVKDSVIAIVNEAREWLKQVHIQVLIPVSYTPDKSNRLMVKENNILNVTDLIPIRGTNRLLIQRKRDLSIFHMLTREEITLATLSQDIISVHLPDDENLVVLTTDESSKFAVEVYNLQNGTHEKTLPLGNSSVLWFDVRSTKRSYFAVSSSIKCADLERGIVTNVLTTKKEWAEARISSSKPDMLLTLSIGEKTTIEAIAVQDITDRESVILKNEPANSNCNSLLSTKDGRYLICVTERQAAVIDCSVYRVINTYTYNGLPVMKAELSRSHEHIFLAYANGAITCHVLHSGHQCMTTKIKPKLQSSSKSQKRDHSSTTDNSQNDDHAETITSLVTTEDDHFLFSGTDLGHIYVIHVPTGLQLVDITTQQKSIEKIIYLTNNSHFQHLISLDVGETARHWNLRPLLKQARIILQQYITDSDLLNEEKTKLDLNAYFEMYETRRHNRMFLNGPDIKAFFNVPVKDIFTDLVYLDPAFNVQNDWEATGTLADLSEHLMALVCANELSGTIMTVSRDLRLAKWNLQNGSLVWSRRLPGQGEIIHDIVSVYYDQAVLLVQQSRVGHGYGISVIYTGEGHSKMMSRDNVTCYWISLDRTRVMLMCQGNGLSETVLYIWDLINTKEETCQPILHPKEGNQSFISFSPNLQSNVCLVVLGDDETTTHLKWSYKNTHFKCGELDLNSAPDPNFVSSRTDSDTHSRFTDSRNTISRTEMYQTDSFLQADQMQNLSDSLSNIQERPNLSLGSAGNSKNANSYDTGELTASLHKQLPLQQIKTYIYWRKVCVNTFRSHGVKEKQRETNNDHAMLKLPDKGTVQSGGKASSTSCNHTANHKIQHKIDTDLKSIATGGTLKEEKEDIALEKNEILSDVNYSEVIIPVQVTSVCFLGEQAILLGTSSQHLLMLQLPSLQSMYALGQDGPKLGNEITEAFLASVSTPHKNPITYITTSEDLKFLISCDRNVVCLWDTDNWTLIMKTELGLDQKISHLVISKDAVIIAMVTNSRIIRLWTPVEHREVASYMTTFDITDLQMTSDCHKVIVRGISPENKSILEIFDILNIDDILIHVDSRKEQQQHERREHLTNERKANRQQTKNWQKSQVLNVINESL